MTWLIFIHLYLWKNSFRRWIEQPLSLLSKIVVAGLLGILGAFVILGIKELGRQLDARLADREALTAIISETIPKEEALTRIEQDLTKPSPWEALPGEALNFYQAGSLAKLNSSQSLVIVGSPDLEKLGWVDEFHLLSERLPAGSTHEFEIETHSSEATVIRPSPEIKMLLMQREGILGSINRLAAVFARGFTETTILRADSLDTLEKADLIVAALKKVEGRRIFIRSNLILLRELQKIRAIQAQALVWITIGCGGILGLVFGSLAWMEFREERYLLALIRTFGVGGFTLLIHALFENCLLAISGVFAGFGILALISSSLNLKALNLTWLANQEALWHGDGRYLILGALLGGIFSTFPIAIGLRKPLGLVLS